MTDGELAALEKALLDESADPVDLPFSLLQSITGNFSEAQEIGRGGFGAVYKGVLPSGSTVAVKKLFERFEILDKNFESEVACLVGVKHKNTVRFLGYCSETQHVMMPYDGKLVWADVRQRLLCFEYLPKGCLADYLSDASCRLQWTTRYQIIKGICEGIHYLHQQRIIHMDLKPQNILLDDNMVPRITDFGLSRRLDGSQSQAITENKLGTMGYMAPEFLNNGEITFKTDIYSLGIIIMEILLGHKECSNVKEVVESWTNKFGASKSQIALEQVKVCAKIGIKCMNYEPGNRPGTWFIIRGILSEAEISNWSVASDVATSTEGQISFASTLANKMKLMDDSAAALSQLQPSALEMEQQDGEVSQERKRKASTISFSKMLDELKLMDDFAAPPQQKPSALEVEQEDDKVSQEKKRKTSTISETHNQLEEKEESYIPEIRAAFDTLCNTRGLPWPKDHEKKADADLFEWLQAMFGFQKDNVSKQRKNLLSVLVSTHIMQISKPEQLPKQYFQLDDLALDTALKKLLKNYKRWCKYLGRKTHLWLPTVQREVQRRKILYMGLYLLIWGEAGNLRFMPECLWYLYHHMAFELYGVVAESVSPTTGESVTPAYGGEQGDFLKKVDEAERNKAVKLKHSHWGNYDDLNAYFWSSNCFQLGWPMRADADFFKKRCDLCELCSSSTPQVCVRVYFILEKVRSWVRHSRQWRWRRGGSPEFAWLLTLDS